MGQARGLTGVVFPEADSCEEPNNPEVSELLVFFLGASKTYKQVSAEMSFNFSFCNYTQNVNVVKISFLPFFLHYFFHRTMKYSSFSSCWHVLQQGETKEEVKCSVKPQSQEKKVATF